VGLERPGACMAAHEGGGGVSLAKRQVEWPTHSGLRLRLETTSPTRNQSQLLTQETAQNSSGVGYELSSQGRGQAAPSLTHRLGTDEAEHRAGNHTEDVGRLFVAYPKIQAEIASIARGRIVNERASFYRVGHTSISVRSLANWLQLHRKLHCHGIMMTSASLPRASKNVFEKKPEPQS
jgi:hypothetical protein